MFPTPACFDGPLIPELHRKWAMWSCHPKCLLRPVHGHQTLPAPHAELGPLHTWRVQRSAQPHPSSVAVCSSEAFPLSCGLFSWLSSSDFHGEQTGQPGSHTCWGSSRQRVPGRPPTAPRSGTATAEKALPRAVCPASGLGAWTPCTLLGQMLTGMGSFGRALGWNCKILLRRPST